MPRPKKTSDTPKKSNYERTADFHKQVATEIIALIEKGTAPWMKPWKDGIPTGPHNGSSGRKYHGFNYLWLAYKADELGYSDPRWYTFKQINDAGGRLRKDEHGVKIEFWQFEKEIVNELGEKEMVRLDPPLSRHFTVFNAEQAEGLPEYKKPEVTWTPVERAETIMKAAGVPIYHDQSDRNFYTPAYDEIHLTPKAAFATDEAYYGTALHELGHSTGHESRLNRNIRNSFGNEDYAREELRAEIASYMLCNELGIVHDVGSNEQHAAYVASWIKSLKEDPNEIFRAARDAEKITDFLYEKEKEFVKNRDMEEKEEKIIGPSRLSEENNLEAASHAMFKAMPDEPKGNIKEGADMPEGQEQIVNKTAEGKEVIYATEAQKNYMYRLGIKFDEQTTKDAANKSIEAKLEKNKEHEAKMNAPASAMQLEILEQEGIKYDKGITVGEASKIIGRLPATSEQLKAMDSMKLAYDENITRGVASKLMNAKLRRDEARNNSPATEKQIEFLKNHGNGIKISEDMTFAEARRAIYNSPATKKQKEFLDKHKIQYDPEVNFYGAKKLIDKRVDEIEKSQAMPMTEKQESLLKEKGLINENNADQEFTRGDAAKMIRAHLKAEKEAREEALEITDKQKETAAKLGVVFPEGADRKAAGDMLSIAIRTDNINGFTKPETRKMIPAEVYKSLAKNMVDNFKPVNDKSIAASMLKSGIASDSVKRAIFANSPNNLRYTYAEEMVKKAMAMPSVKNAMEKGKQKPNGR